jgi:hypothetical protein
LLARTAPPGSRCWQDVSADRNAGDFVSNAFLYWRGAVLGSGKSAMPCERMQSANLTAACSLCCLWAEVDGAPELDALDELGELEPHAAITVAAAIAAVAAGRMETVLNMTQVVAGWA